MAEEKKNDLDLTAVVMTENPPPYTEKDSNGDVIAQKDDVKKEEEDDPWAIVQDQDDDGEDWDELSCGRKTKSVFFIIFKIILVIGFLYLFICSLGLLGDGFKLVGGKTAGKAFRQNALLRNPIAGLMIGVLATVLLQSSSTTTTIIVTLAGEDVLPIQSAIPMVMGANIGTSVTNTIVSLAQSTDRKEFRRAFGGATVHDMFNWLTVIILLPLEVATHYLYYLTDAMVNSMHIGESSDHDQDMLKVITKPFTSLIISINKAVIEDIATNKAGAEDQTVLKRWCKDGQNPYNVSVAKEIDYEGQVDNDTLQSLTLRGIDYNITQHHFNLTSGINGTNITEGVNLTLSYMSDETRYHTVHVGRCNNLFAQTDLSDNVAGIILLVGSLILLILTLMAMVKLLHSLLRGSLARVVKKYINAEFPGKMAWATGYVAILIGAGMTMIVQSSSVFTSTLTPLVGVGVVSINRMYPLTLGANIGTTLTGILAALTLPGREIKVGLHVALCHLFFNITGILIFYPIPFMRKAPIGLAKALGNKTAKYRWFSVLYLIGMFFLLPGAVFGLTIAGNIALIVVGVPLLLLLISVAVLNIAQAKCSNRLPLKLKTWNFLPLCCHSLKPADKIISKVTSICTCCDKTENKDVEGADNKGFEEAHL